MQELIIKEEDNIKDMIYEVRGKQVMLDSDVAKLYSVETKRINEVVKRNLNRFPEDFCFQLTMEEIKNLCLRSQIATLNTVGNLRGLHYKYLPYAFTEHGVMMLSGLLKSDIAVKVNIQIINAFILIKKYISSDFIEQNYYNKMLIKHDNDIKLLQESFNKLTNLKETTNHIFFEGQIYDAYSKIIDILSISNKELIIIDNYADKTLLDIISKINKKTLLITSKNNYIEKIDINKYHEQYNNLKVITNNTFHDRYFIIDKTIFYHCGTSLNNAGTKTFSINRIEDGIVKKSLIDKVKDINNSNI